MEVIRALLHEHAGLLTLKFRCNDGSRDLRGMKGNNRTCIASFDNSRSSTLRISPHSSKSIGLCIRSACRWLNLLREVRGLTHIHPPTTPIPATQRLRYPPSQTRFPQRRQFAQTRPCPVWVPDEVYRADAFRQDVDYGYPDDLRIDFVEEVVRAVFGRQVGGGWGR